MQNTKNEAGTSLPQAFTFNATDQQIRTAVISGEPFFVAKDVCSILDISNNRDAIIDLDDDEKLMSVIPTPGQKRQVWLVNESGLYHLIFQSRKPEAKAFRRWVTSSVLPRLRRHGSYLALPDVPCRTVNGRRMYPYRRMAGKLGYSEGGSMYERRRRHPGQFVSLDGLLYASEEICLLMAASRNTLRMRRSVAELRPMLGEAREYSGSLSMGGK